MNDIRKSYYELAQEEYNKKADANGVVKPGGNAGRMAMPQEDNAEVGAARSRARAVMEQLVAEGSPFGTDGFFEEFDRRMGIDQNDPETKYPYEDDVIMEYNKRGEAGLLDDVTTMTPEQKAELDAGLEEQQRRADAEKNDLNKSYRDIAEEEYEKATREPAGVEGTEQGEKDPVRNKQDREDEEDEDEMMDKEQAAQAKKMKRKGME